jgi:cyanophycinase
MKPKGTLLLIGGAEDRGDGRTPQMEGRNKDFEHFEILKEMVPAKGDRKKIEVITTASSEQEEMMKMYKAAFRKIGFSNTGFMAINSREEARDPAFTERIRKAHAVLFSGGDQFKLSTILGGTDIVEVIRDKYMHDPDFIIAGTSAGAMVMSKVMIYEGGVEESILKGDLLTSAGIGVFDTCIIDTHFIKRGRFGRLAHAIVMNPETLGIGLGEDTVLIIKNGSDAECRGSGMVVVIDGKGIGQTNIAEVEDKHPIFVENLRVHLLCKGCCFSIAKRQFRKQRALRKNKAGC